MGQKPSLAKTINKYKVVLVGGPCVGKSCIFHRVLKNEYRSSSGVGVNIGLKSIEIDGGDTVVVELWDVPSIVEMKKDCQSEYLDACDAVIFVYSKTDASSLGHAMAYWNCIGNNVPAVVLKSKCDCVVEQLPDAEALTWLGNSRLDSFDVSAKENQGINVALKLLLFQMNPAPSITMEALE
ncbi:hypothetical protein THRCLA_00781 [Thraustotheca clavata]|uniref:Uncharacterized protein n=1 Tax=Thraustotheca clavata TaxID=74557 RepID=A0A1W0AAK5_9STRA|nr:hypothetical protein THRCLA_00781 [Thraustotheca clavata]